MKSRFWSLYSSLLNVHYGWSSGKYYFLKKKQRIWEPILIGFGLVPLIVIAMGFTWVITEQLYLMGLAFAQPHLALVYGALIVSVLGLFFGFFHVLSAFYLSNDLPILVPLPLRSWEILLAKFGVILTGQYVINAVILLPMWLRYALLAQVGWGYLATSLMVFFTLPLIPLVIASLVTMLLMRFINLSRHKDKLTLFGGLLLVILILGFQFWLQNNVGNGDPEILLAQILSETDGLVRVIGRVFPTSLWSAQAMAYASTFQGWFNLMYLLGASIFGIVVLYFLGEKIFLQGLVAGLEGDQGSPRKKVAGGNLKERSLFRSLVSTEIKLFMRDPGFALNGLIGYVLLPFFALLPLFTKNIPENPFDFLAQGEFPFLVIVGGIALFFMFMTAMSMISSTTFSREGKYLWIMRSMPISIEQVIFSRVVAGQVINILGCLLGLIPVAYVFRWGVGVVLAGAVLGTLLATVLSYLLILLDLSRPMLDWVNPIKAVKSNLNAMIGLVGAMLFVLMLGVGIYAIFQAQLLWLIPLELVFAFLFIAILDYYLVKKFAEKMWRKIEKGM